MDERAIGRVTHFFSKIGVAAIEVTEGVLAVGDTIHVKGHTSDFTVRVDSMQLDGHAVERATKGQNVGIRIPGHAREHDVVLKVEVVDYSTAWV
jgi:putative protease